jgi:SPP1 gp7 family putative phage head morphogenesis protein
LGATVTDEVHSLSAAQVKAALMARANTVAAQVSGTTYQAIAKQLAEGMEAGESIPQLADRVKTVFADATDNRATMISRTESSSASNTAQITYARNLPTGIVAGKAWLAVDDYRTRPTHRIADGQTRPLDLPFNVGGFNMDRPGDPAAPPSETIGCRCTTILVPQSQAHLLLQQPVKDFTYNPQAPTAA